MEQLRRVGINGALPFVRFPHDWLAVGALVQIVRRNGTIVITPVHVVRDAVGSES